MRQAIIFLFLAVVLFSCEKSDSISPSNGSNTGQGGSMARFTIAMDHLYIVDDRKLYTYSLEHSSKPQMKSSMDIGFDIETIYAYKDKLFIGSNDAMYVYSIAEASHPKQLGTARHARACDPVIANNFIAYVTVRSTGSCGGNTNMLYVYDITDIQYPEQVNAVPMEGPWGLGMKGNRLYVCNGSNGLNIYDITNPVYPKLIGKRTDDAYYDVIVTDDLLICMVEGGTALYEFHPNDEILLKAKITD